MRWSVIGQFLLTAMILSGPSTVLAQELQCQQLKSLEQDLLNNLPVPVDEFTSLVGLNVNCEKREIQFVKHLSVPASALEPDVVERKQIQYRNLHCNSEGFATRGWTTRDYIYDEALELVMALEASPSMC